MEIYPGAQPADFEQAVSLAYRKVDVRGVSPGVATLFQVADTAEFAAEAEKRIDAAVRAEYQCRPQVPSWWLVPAPKLSYDSREVPHLSIEVRRYLVAAVLVWRARRSQAVALIGPMGKPETLTVPLVFLHAVLKRDLGRFAVVARSGSHTTWEMPGARPVRLSDSFVSGLSDVLCRKSVSAWLEDFGPAGRSVMPLVVGNLLGLEFQGSTGTVPVESQPWTQELLAGALVGMAYTEKEARLMMAKAGQELRPELTMEEAIKVVLQQAARGG